MTRSEARELLMHLIFQMEAQEDCSLELRDLFLRDKKVPEQHQEYILQGFDAAREHLKDVDARLNRYSEKWTTTRMPKADLAILRLAATEILYLADIPDAVAIDEAVDLAKKYGCDNSAKYINGVLGRIAAEKAPAPESPEGAQA